MNKIVRPVRAWGTFENWYAVFEYVDSHKYWLIYAIPSGTEGESHAESGGSSLPEAFRAAERLGRLQTFRVAFDNGARLWAYGFSDNNEWVWQIYDFRVPASGEFIEDNDANAVERAIITATAEFTQAE